MTKIVTVYHSGYGHTKKLAEAVHEGVGQVDGVDAHLVVATDYHEKDALDFFDDAAGIIFGCPTYMGGPSADFKKFIDAAGAKWLQRAWVGKVAGGFTNSGSLSGDKQSTLIALAVNAMQQGMIWVPQIEMPASNKGGHDGQESPGPDAVNRLGAFMGVMAKSANQSPEGPSQGDLETGRRYGKHVAEVTLQFLRGKA